MNYHYTDIPVYFPLSSYQAAIDQMSSQLMKTGKVLGIFQVGGISTPGISDVDFYVVFKNNSVYSENPATSSKYPGDYFFIHRLFGTTEEFARNIEHYTLFGNYNHIAGEKFNMFTDPLTPSDETLLKHQIALEYLVKAWISVSLSIHMGKIKLRTLLLHSKAVQYDISFLEIKNSALISSVNELMEVRNNWFSSPVSFDKLDVLINSYQKGLESAITESLNLFTFYNRNPKGVSIGKNVSLQPGNKLSMKHSGIKFPFYLTSKSNFISKLHQKLGHYNFTIPMSHSNIPPILEKRHTRLHEAAEYNRKYLPGFLCTAYAMNTFQ